MKSRYTNRPANAQRDDYPFIRRPKEHNSLPPGLATLAVLTATMALTFGIRCICRPESDTVETLTFDFDESTAVTMSDVADTQS